MEFNEIAKQQIADYLKSLMKKKGITANQIIVKSGLHNSAVYSVLRMGKYNPNYTMDTFLTVCRYVGVHLELHDLAEKNNWDLAKLQQKHLTNFAKHTVLSN